MLFPEATGTFQQPSPPLGPDTAHASSALMGGPPPMPLLSLPRAVARLSQPARAERLCVHSPKACRTGTTGSWGPGQGWAFKCQAPCSHCWSGFANQPHPHPASPTGPQDHSRGPGHPSRRLQRHRGDQPAPARGAGTWGWGGLGKGDGSSLSAPSGLETSWTPCFLTASGC